MSPAVAALDEALTSTVKLEALIKKGRQAQVRSSDERSLAKATAHTWFQNHRPHVISSVDASNIAIIDEAFNKLLESSERAGARSRYKTTLKQLKADIQDLRFVCMSLPGVKPPETITQPPDFSQLVPDKAMDAILIARWNECMKCLDASAPMAATVMMGGLLEALLLARINKEPNTAQIFTAASAPKDKTGKTKLLREWMLNDFIQVVYELKWISVSARDVGAVLRDYRNYIHPQKQLSHGIHLSKDDAVLLWEVCKNISRQIIKSVP